MLDAFAIIALISGVLVTPYLFYRSYRLEQRCHGILYCWQAMSDFAGEQSKSHDGEPGLWWQDVTKEHLAFMKRFGVRPGTDDEINQYEWDLLRRNINPLEEHKG